MLTIAVQVAREVHPRLLKYPFQSKPPRGNPLPRVLQRIPGRNRSLNRSGLRGWSGCTALEIEGIRAEGV